MRSLTELFCQHAAVHWHIVLCSRKLLTINNNIIKWIHHIKMAMTYNRSMWPCVLEVIYIKLMFYVYEMKGFAYRSWMSMIWYVYLSTRGRIDIPVIYASVYTNYTRSSYMCSLLFYLLSWHSALYISGFDFNPFLHIDTYSRLCSRWLLKSLWQNEKLLIMSNFTIFPNDFNII